MLEGANVCSLLSSLFVWRHGVMGIDESLAGICVVVFERKKDPSGLFIFGSWRSKVLVVWAVVSHRDDIGCVCCLS